jgi:hypothetical protein
MKTITLSNPDFVWLMLCLGRLGALDPNSLDICLHLVNTINGSLPRDETAEAQAEYRRTFLFSLDPPTRAFAEQEFAKLGLYQ